MVVSDGFYCVQTITPEEEDGMPVNLPKDLAEKARNEAAEFRGDGEKGESSTSEPGGDAESSIGNESREEGEPAEYEFTVWEDRILEVVMEAMRMAGLALAVRAIGTFCLGALHFKHFFFVLFVVTSKEPD